MNLLTHIRLSFLLCLGVVLALFSSCSTSSRLKSTTGSNNYEPALLAQSQLSLDAIAKTTPGTSAFSEPPREAGKDSAQLALSTPAPHTKQASTSPRIATKSASFRNPIETAKSFQALHAYSYKKPSRKNNDDHYGQAAFRTFLNLLLVVFIAIITISLGILVYTNGSTEPSLLIGCIVAIVLSLFFIYLIVRRKRRLYSVGR